MKSDILGQIYDMLSLKNKKKLDEDWSIDSPYDLETRVEDELTENNYFNYFEIIDNIVYIDVKNSKTVRIKADEEGIVVDIFQKPDVDGFGEPITSTWCLYSEE